MRKLKSYQYLHLNMKFVYIGPRPDKLFSIPYTDYSGKRLWVTKTNINFYVVSGLH